VGSEDGASLNSEEGVEGKIPTCGVGNMLGAIVVPLNGLVKLTVGETDGPVPASFGDADGDDTLTVGETDGPVPASFGDADGDDTLTVGETDGPVPASFGDADGDDARTVGDTDGPVPASFGDADGDDARTVGDTDGPVPATEGDDVTPPTVGGPPGTESGDREDKMIGDLDGLVLNEVGCPDDGSKVGRVLKDVG
jgi:hypothetical protein